MNRTNLSLSATFLSAALIATGCTATDMQNPESDFADGTSKVAARGALEDPGEYGLYIEEQLTIPGSASNRDVKTTLCAPANADRQSIAQGAFPLLILSPGAQQDRDQYRSYCEHLGTWGFVVLSQSIIGNDGFFPPANHWRPAADISAMIDWAVSADSGLADHLDATAIGVVGHSMGGKVSFLAAAQDERIGAVVGWDPVDANGPFTPRSSPDWSSVTPEMMPDLLASVAVIGETVNSRGGFFSPACAPSANNFQQYYEHADTAALEVEIFDADHMDWTDSSACWPCSPCGSADHDFVHAITRRVTTAWFLLHLLGDTSVEDELALATEVEAGLVGVQAK